MNAHGLAAILLLLGAAGIAADAPSRPATGAVARPPGAAAIVPRPAEASPDTPWVAPEPPHPTARYGSLNAAAESLRSIVRSALGAWADSARWSRARESFEFHDGVRLVRTTRGEFYWDAVAEREARVPCLHMRWESHVAGAPGNESIEDALKRAGWDVDDRYSADGPDGTYYALACREALVEIRGTWDGGDDSDTTYVPAPGESVELRCVPRPPEPRPRGRRVP